MYFPTTVLQSLKFLVSHFGYDTFILLMISFSQVAFVLCRLFKKAEDLKPDDNEDGYHTEEVETNIYSPTPTNVSQKDVRSEPMPRKISEYRLDDGSPEDLRSEPAVVQASPVSVEQSVEQQMTSETFVVKPCDSITSKPVLPDHPRVNKEVVHEVSIPLKSLFQFVSTCPSLWRLTICQHVVLCCLSGGFLFQ